MAKKKDAASKGGKFVPPASSIQNREALQRFNFMTQASIYLAQAQQAASASTSTSTSTSMDTTNSKKRARGKGIERKRRTALNRVQEKEGGTLGNLSRGLVHTIREISVHNKVQIDASLKRSICEGCSTILIPGLNSHIRVKASQAHLHTVLQACSTCSHIASLPRPPLSEPHVVNANASGTAPVDVPTAGSGAGISRFERRMRKAQKKLPLFEREDAGHLIYVGDNLEDNKTLDQTQRCEEGRS